MALIDPEFSDESDSGEAIIDSDELLIRSTQEELSKKTSAGVQTQIPDLLEQRLKDLERKYSGKGKRESSAQDCKNKELRKLVEDQELPSSESDA